MGRWETTRDNALTPQQQSRCGMTGGKAASTGTVFVTIEDEYGDVDWQGVILRGKRVAGGASLFRVC